MIPRDILVKHYSAGKSMMEISKILSFSPHKISYWMHKYNLPRRSLSEASYVKHNPNGDPFKIKTDLSPKEKYLMGLGLGIYWGEGDKTTPHGVRIANSDPKLIVIFRKFLREICQIKESKIKYALIVFNDSDPLVAANYWSKLLKTSVAQFGKITVIPPQGKGTYKKKSLYGVCTMGVNNIKLKAWVLEQLAIA